MRASYKGMLLGVVQVALVASLGGKLLFDRATRPRFWLIAVPVDPDMPLRGRYVSLRVQIPAAGPSISRFASPGSGAFPEPLRKVRIESGPEGAIAIVEADSSPGWDGLRGWRSTSPAGLPVVTLVDELSYFIPEHVDDPARRPAGEELWVEVTQPRKGPLRPIRLGVKKAGVLTPLSL